MSLENTSIPFNYACGEQDTLLNSVSPSNVFSTIWTVCFIWKKKTSNYICL